MSNTHSSPTDELGSGSTSLVVRTISDFTTFDATNNRHILNRNTGHIVRRKLLVTTLPVLITAGDTIRFRAGPNFNTLWVYVGAADTPMFMALPMKRGIIQSFSDNAGTLRVNATAHTLNVSDFVKIDGSRTSTYNGNQIITAVTTNTFDIDAVTFVDVDGQCNWIQGKVFVSSAVTGGGNLTELTAVNHPFAANDWINLYDTTSTTPIDGTFQITAVTTNTLTIDTGTPFVETTTGNIDTGIGTFDMDHDLVVNEPTSGLRRNLFQLSGSFSPTVRSLMLAMRVGFIGFDIGETKDFSLVSLSHNTLLSESNNWRSLDDGIFDINRVILEVVGAPSVTSDYQSVFVMGGGGNVNGVIDNNDLAIINQVAGLTIPEELGENLRFSLQNVRNLTNSTYFSTGHFERASAVIFDDSTFVGFPLTDTTPFRVGDTIEYIESTTYSGTATVDSIVENTSLTLSTTFSVADADVLIQNQKANSIDATDPRMSAFSNQELKNSMAAAETTLDTTLTVAFGTIDTYVAINQNSWDEGFLERFTLDGDPGDGIITYTGLETADFVVNFNCTIGSTTGAAQDFVITIRVNASDTVIHLPVKVNADSTAIQISGSDIIELVTGDTLQMVIKNTSGTVSASVKQASIILLRGG